MLKYYTRRFQLSYSYWIFFRVSRLPELLCDGAVKVVTIRNCYIQWVRFLDGSVNYDCVWSVVMYRSTSYYGPFTVQFLIGVLWHGLWLIFIIKHWWSVWQFTFDSQQLTDNRQEWYAIFITGWEQNCLCFVHLSCLVFGSRSHVQRGIIWHHH